MSSSQNHNSTHNPKLLFIIFVRESSLYIPTLIYRSEEAAVQWCTQQLQSHNIKYYPTEKDQFTMSTVKITGQSKSDVGLEMMYTIKRCEHGDDPQVDRPIEKKTTAELWVHYDKVQALVRGTYVDKEAGMEGWKKEEQRYTWHNNILRCVRFGNE
ncbi:MAG: hypothetical protein Q9168_001356 [Polycauliona sp. 1 TL-2023]